MRCLYKTPSIMSSLFSERLVLCYGSGGMARKRKNPHAAALGRKGGKARWQGVPKEERSEILRRAVQARWAKATTRARKGGAR